MPRTTSVRSAPVGFLHAGAPAGIPLRLHAAGGEWRLDPDRFRPSVASAHEELEALRALRPFFLNFMEKAGLDPKSAERLRFFVLLKTGAWEATASILGRIHLGTRNRLRFGSAQADADKIHLGTAAFAPVLRGLSDRIVDPPSGDRLWFVSTTGDTIHADTPEIAAELSTLCDIHRWAHARHRIPGTFRSNHVVHPAGTLSHPAGLPHPLPRGGFAVKSIEVPEAARRIFGEFRKRRGKVSGTA